MKKFFPLLFLAVNASAGTYFIDFVGGADGNVGTTPSAPWKHHPFMAGWTGKYTHGAGDRFIFKGGVTWDHTCFPLSVSADGSSGAGNDYYGVDTTWFAGAAWSRPVFDGEHIASSMVSVSSRHRVTIDNLEIKRLMASANYGPGLISIYNSDNVSINNCYIHDWQLSPSISTDDAHGGVIATFGGYGITNVVIDHCEIANAENSSRQNGVCIRQVGTVRFSKIHDAPTAILFAGDIHDNEIYNIDYPNSDFDPAYHRNLAYIDSWNGSMPITTPAYFYNNLVHDWGNGASGVYPNPGAGDKTIYVYNNVIYGHQSAQLAIEIDPYAYGAGGALGSVYCYNNTILNFAANAPAIHVVNRGGSPMLKLLVAQNNHVIGTGAAVTDGGGGTVATVTSGNNLVQATTTATSQGYTAGNLWKPGGAGASTVNAGTSAPSTLFTLDISGVPRPQGGAWDIGAYEYTTNVVVSPSNLPPTVSAIGVNAGDVDPLVSGMQVYEGTTVTLNGSASDPNFDALTWQWIYTINGGAETVFQSGPGTVSPVSYTYPAGSAGRNYTWKLRVSDGQTTAESQLAMSVEATPAPLQGLTFPASAGALSGLFTLANGSISQSVQTTVPTNGGRAAFNFTITNAGYYVIQAAVNAPDDSANSFYVNIDAEPQDPVMIWDIVMTSGFEQRLVSWRGNGSDTANQFVPKVFNLAQGAHQVIFRGREANVQLQGLSILQLPAPPQNLRVLPSVVPSVSYSMGQ